LHKKIYATSRKLSDPFGDVNERSHFARGIEPALDQSEGSLSLETPMNGSTLLAA